MTLLILLAGLIMVVLGFDRFAPASAARLGLALERRRSGLALRQLTAGGFRMPYLAGGKGAPVVLVHGFGGDKDNFTRVARFLTGTHQVLIPDLPGFGDAGRDLQADYFIADQVERLHAFLLQLGLGRIHLGGNSMGGFIAAEYAARYPDQVASLWLLDAAGTAAAFDSELIGNYRSTGEMPLLLRAPEEIGAMLRACTFRPPFVPYSVKHQLGQRGVADFALHERILKQVHHSPLLETRGQPIATPTLIVWGKEDRVLSPAGAAALSAIMPNSRVILMPEVGHLPMVEAPRQAARDYLQFLHSLAAPAELPAAPTVESQ